MLEVYCTGSSCNVVIYVSRSQLQEQQAFRATDCSALPTTSAVPDATVYCYSLTEQLLFLKRNMTVNGCELGHICTIL